MMRRTIEPNKAIAFRNFAVHLCGKQVRIVERLGTQLKTDGNVIFVPTVSDEMIDTYRNILFGGIWHESGHIKRTDIDYFRKAIMESNSIEESMFRVLEDIRVDMFEARQNAVAGDEIGNLRATLCQQNVDAILNGNLDPYSSPKEYIYTIGLHLIMNQFGIDIGHLPESIRDVVNQLIPDVERFVDVMQGGYEGTRQAKEHGFEMAKKLENAMREMAKELAEHMLEPDGNQEEEEEQEESEEGEECKKGKEDGNNKGKKKKKIQRKQKTGGTDDSESDEEESEEEVGEGEPGDMDDEFDSGGDDETEGDEEGDVAGGDSDGEADNAGGGTDTTCDDYPDDDSDGTEEYAYDPEEEAEDGEENEEEMRTHVDMVEVEGELAEGETGKSSDSIQPDEDGKAEITARIGKGNSFQENNEDFIEQAKKAGVKDLYINILQEASDEMSKEAKGGTKVQHLPHPDITPYDKEEIAPEGVKRIYYEDKAKVQVEISRLKRKLQYLIMGKKRTHFIPDRREGEVDVTNLYSLRAGNKRIFQELEATRNMNTAIIILLDVSGSMCYGGKYQMVRRAAVACGEELHNIQVPFEILSFTTDWSHHIVSKLETERYTPGGREDQKMYNRFAPLKHSVYKSFNDNYKKVKYRLASIEACDDNCDHESVLWAAQRLYDRPEKRKILFVLSDGMPATGGSDMFLLERELKATNIKIEKRGIELYGVGIYTDAVKKFYREWSVIEEGRDNIAQAIFKCLQKKLTQHL